VTSIDPSTIWDIVTDPDNIDDVYYYHQQYPTQYAQFTGYSVPGVPGSAQVKSMEYIIRQIPYTDVIHLKAECVSNEKRGRSVLFPILGWLKRVKDFYNAVVIKAEGEASFIWDDLIKGGDGDVQAHVQKYETMPPPGSVFAHNEAVTRTAMQALTGAKGSNSAIGSDLLCFIATAVGFPKDFFNVSGEVGSRATALVGAEPFQKVVEDLQREFEDLLLQLSEVASEQAGVKFDRKNVEFIFPSIVKDSTSETIKNISQGETQGYIDKETAGTMYAAEMNITHYDFEETQKKVSEQKEKALDQATGVPIPPGRFGNFPPKPNPLNGQAKVDLARNLNQL
jgi:hypothetical protein